MPIARFQMPDGRIGRFEVPDGTTPEQAQQMISEQVGGQQATAQPTEPAKQSWLDEVKGGIASGPINLYLGAKQILGGLDPIEQDVLRQNKAAASKAPVSAFLGEAAMTAVPFGMAGNGLRAAAAVGAGYGSLQPVEGEQTLSNIAQGKGINAAIGGAFGAGGQAIANKAGNMISKKVADLAARKSANAPIDATIREAINAGYQIPPGQVNPSFLNRQLESMGGKIATQQMASSNNAAVTDRLARSAAGLAENSPITPEALKAARSVMAKPYRDVEALGSLAVDPAYNLGKLGPEITGAAKAQTVFTDQFGNLVDNVPKMPKPDMQRNLINELIRNGGIAKAELGDMGVEGVKRPGLIRKDGAGKTADDLVEWMEQTGWLSARDVENANRFDSGGSHDLARGIVKDAIEGRPVFHPSEEDAAYTFAQQMSDWGAKYGGLEKTKIPAKGGEISAKAAIDQLRQLRSDANAQYRFYSRSADPSAQKLAQKYSDAAKSLESFLERSAESAGKPELVSQLRQARVAMAKNFDVETALIEGGGTIDARAIAKMAQRGDPLTGELATIGNFANNFPKITQPDKTIGTPDSHNLKYIASLLMGSGGMAAGGPAGMALGALPMLSGPAARSAMFSKAMQRGLLSNYELGMLPRVSGGLLQYAPVGGTVLGLDALGK